jgi:hypothetical protein
MHLLRLLVRVNLFLSMGLLLGWAAYRHHAGLPLDFDPELDDNIGPVWLELLITQAILGYVVSSDARFSELFARLLGAIWLFGLIWAVVLFMLQQQVYGSNDNKKSIFSWYQQASIAVFALVGKRPLSRAEVERLTSMLSTRPGEDL